MKAVKEKEQLQKTVDSWKNSSKNLCKLVDSGMSSTSKVGLGYEIKSNDEVLSYEEEMNRTVFNCIEEDFVDKPLYGIFSKTDNFKGVQHPLTGDYTPQPQQEIDDSFLSHLIKNYDFYEKKMAREAELKKQRVFNTGNGVAKPVWNNANRVNHANHFVPRPVQLIAVRQNVNSVRPNVNTGRANVNSVRQNVNSVRSNVNTGSFNINIVKAKQPIHTSNSNSFSPVRPQDQTLKNIEDIGIYDSGCPGHMTGNKDHLDDFEECKGGSVTFGGSKGYITGKGRIRVGNLDFDSVSFVKELGHFNLFSISQICDKQHKVLFTETECLVVSPDFKMPDENQILLKVPRQHNMYSFDMKTPAPAKDYTCLIAKATSDESKLWHRRLGHINFKNLNKLVKGNLVRGLPSKVFRNDHTCVACHKGTSEVTNSAGTLQTPNANASEEEDEAEELIVVPTTVRHTASKVRPRKSSTNSKAEEFLIELQNLKTQEKEAYSTGISEDTPEILAFRRELDELALKHLREVPKNKATSTTSVNSGSGPVIINMLVRLIRYCRHTSFNKPQKVGVLMGFFYDDEGMVYDFNNLPKNRVQQNSGAHALEEPKKISEALKDDSWVEAMQEELLQFRLQQVWILVDLPHGAKVIGTKWVYRNKRDERGVVVRNKARLVAQGHRQEEGID
ncbi:ribonuclease H-like domain-containing protein [Tanacetum coccineum]